MSDRGDGRLWRLFEASLLLKGAFAAFEVVSGIALAVIGTGTIYHIAVVVTQHELLENPNNQIANYLRDAAGALSIGAKTFAAIYLLTHGLIKLGLILELLRGRLWAYPASIVAFSVFIAYQLYRFTLTHSVWLIVLSVFDGFVLWLIWREWQNLKASGSDAIEEAGKASKAP